MTAVPRFARHRFVIAVWFTYASRRNDGNDIYRFKTVRVGREPDLTGHRDLYEILTGLLGVGLFTPNVQCFRRTSRTAAGKTSETK